MLKKGKEYLKLEDFLECERMIPTIHKIVVFANDSGLSLSVVSDADANGRTELSNVVDSISDFYRSQDLKTKVDKVREVDEGDAILYYVKSDEYIGTVKIAP